MQILANINILIGELPRADVVERSEYNKMVQYLQAQIKNKENNLRDNRDAFRRVVKREDKLRSKIDDAIKIAEDCISANFKLGLNERAFGMREILEIFVRNIGENNENKG